MRKPPSRPLVDLIVQSICKSLSKTHSCFSEVHESIESFTHELPRFLSVSKRVCVRWPNWLATGPCSSCSRPSTHLRTKLRLGSKLRLGGCWDGSGRVVTVYLNSRWPCGSSRNRRCVWHFGLFIYTRFHVQRENICEIIFLPTRSTAMSEYIVFRKIQIQLLCSYVFRSNS